MNSISKRLREIDEELSKLYQEKHALELEQQEYWRKMEWCGPITANAEDNFEEIYLPEIDKINLYKKSENVDEHGNWAFDNEWSGTLLG